MQATIRRRIIIRKGPDFQRIQDSYYITQGQLCAMLGISRPMFWKLVNEKAPLTKMMAMKGQAVADSLYANPPEIPVKTYAQVRA